MLFIKGLLIGIGKIIPGISGAMLAINFNIYEDALTVLNNFFDNPKKNTKYLLILSSSILLSIILFSNLIYYLINNYKFLTMMFFIGLIIGGTYDFSKKIIYTYKSIILITIVSIFLIILTQISINNLNITNNFLTYFLGGYLDMFATIIPGISGTSLLMILGIYNDIIMLISKIYNYNYVLNNLNIYFIYGLGMFLGAIINIKLIYYLLQKLKNITYQIILSLSISSTLYLLLLTIKDDLTFLEITLGIMLLILGLLLSVIINKKTF